MESESIETFIKLKHAKDVQKSELEIGYEPEWNHIFQMEIRDKSSQKVTLTCIREGMLKDEYIGEASLEVQELVDESDKEPFCIALKENDLKTAEILIEAIFVPKSQI